MRPVRKHTRAPSLWYENSYRMLLLFFFFMASLKHEKQTKRNYKFLNWNKKRENNIIYIYRYYFLVTSKNLISEHLQVHVFLLLLFKISILCLGKSTPSIQNYSYISTAVKQACQADPQTPDENQSKLFFFF